MHEWPFPTTPFPTHKPLPDQCFGPPSAHDLKNPAFLSGPDLCGSSTREPRRFGPMAGACMALHPPTHVAVSKGPSHPSVSAPQPLVVWTKCFCQGDLVGPGRLPGDVCCFATTSWALPLNVKGPPSNNSQTTPWNTHYRLPDQCLGPPCTRDLEDQVFLSGPDLCAPSTRKPMCWSPIAVA